MTDSMFQAKLTKLFGERCQDDYDEQCPTCSAWRLYDRCEWGQLLAVFADIEADLVPDGWRSVEGGAATWNAIEDLRIEALIEVSKLQRNAWPDWGDSPDGFDGPTGAE